jgi:hypothetical protein
LATEPKPIKGRWLPLIYYYLATVVGLAILLVGLIGGLRGVVQAAFPKTADEYRYSSFAVRPPEVSPEGRPVKISERAQLDAEEAAFDRARQAGIADAFDGLIAAVVAGPVFFWHLRQARRREPEWLGLTPQ